MTRLRCMRLGAGPSGTTLEPAYRETGRPYLRRTSGLVRVLHDHDDAAAMTILRTARAALTPGGTLLVAEPMAATKGAETVGSYFEFYLLAMGSGRPRTAGELTAMLQQAGF